MPKIPQTKQNRKYWESRKELERAYIEQRLADDEKFNAELQKRFDRVQEEMQRNIELELYRLSDKNGINIAKVKAAVSQADIKQMESYAKQVVEKAQKLRKELGRPLSQDDFSKEVNDRMRLYNATMRINRLEMIKSRIGMQTVELGLDVNADILRKLNQDYQDQIERQAGIMGDAVPNLTNQELKNAVKSVIATTGGVSFSKRVWGDMDGLKAELDVQLVNSLVQGQSASVIAKNLLPFVSEKFQNKRYAAERIARTESARVDTDATLASLKKYGYKYCQWHDETKACDTCMAIARSNPTGYGQGVYKVDDVPYLPAHPNCRCAISAYWVDEKELSYTAKYLNVTPVKYQPNEKIPVKARPNFVSSRYVEDKVVQYRLYNNEGYALVDFDLTNHGNPKHHKVVPHKHEWTIIKSGNGVKYKRSKDSNIPLTDEELELVKRWREYDN